MSVMQTALTTLDHAKTVTGMGSISTYDATLELLINRISSGVRSFLQRSLTRASYSEVIAPSSRPLLLLKEYPIVSVTSLTCDGLALVLDQDYRLDAQDKARGELYKENGWARSYLVRGLTSDPFNAVRSIEVTYIAGYYLPADVGYIEGADASLPIDIQMVVDNEIASQFLRIRAKAHGLSSYSEGGISMSWKDGSSQGFSDESVAILNAHKRWNVG